MSAARTLNVIQPQVDAVMYERIQRELERIEWEYQCEVLFACESGSRAWGFASEDSDYDVRFIYRCAPQDYVRIGKRRDVIELPIDSELDISGWDITKAMGLLRKSNPSLLEWLQSPIVYRQNDAAYAQLLELAMSSLSASGLFWHYFSMAKNNYARLFQNVKKPLMKRYLYVLRPLLCAKWVARYQTMPPVVFDEVVLGTVRNDKVLSDIEHLLCAKAKSTEKDSFVPTLRLNQMIDTTFASLEKYKPEKRVLRDAGSFDKVLHRLVFQS